MLRAACRCRTAQFLQKCVHMLPKDFLLPVLPSPGPGRAFCHTCTIGYDNQVPTWRALHVDNGWQWYIKVTILFSWPLMLFLDWMTFRFVCFFKLKGTRGILAWKTVLGRHYLFAVICLTNHLFLHFPLFTTPRFVFVFLQTWHCIHHRGYHCESHIVLLFLRQTGWIGFLIWPFPFHSNIKAHDRFCYLYVWTD